MNSLFEQAASALGAPVDHVKLIGLLFISIPLAFPLPYLPQLLQHFYSIIVSFVYLFIILQLKWGFAQLLFMSAATFIMCKTFINTPSVTKRLPVPWPWVVFGLTMTQLTINHGYRYWAETSLDEFEITGPMMVLVQKLTVFAWTMFDRDTKTTHPPVNFLPFLGYCLFFPTFLVGPGIHYAAYISYTSTPLPTGRFTALAKRLAIGSVAMGIFVMYAGKYSYTVINTERFEGYGNLAKMLFVNMAGVIARTKYYAIWSIAESACIMSGVARIDKPTAKDEQWSGARNVRILGIEGAENWKVLLDNWNCFTNVWLRETIYKRLVRKGQKAGFLSTMLTFGTSALWHGLNLAYYLTFFLGGLLQAAARHMRKNVRPVFITDEKAPIRKRGRAWQVVGVLVTQLTVNYAVLPFMMMDLRPTFKAWSRLGWYGHWMTIVPLIFFWAGGGALFRNSKAKKVNGDAKGQINMLGKEGGGQEVVHGIKKDL